jgi:hypothetical protein
VTMRGRSGTCDFLLVDQLVYKADEGVVPGPSAQDHLLARAVKSPRCPGPPSGSSFPASTERTFCVSIFPTAPPPVEGVQHDQGAVERPHRRPHHKVGGPSDFPQRAPRADMVAAAGPAAPRTSAFFPIVGPPPERDL